MFLISTVLMCGMTVTLQVARTIFSPLSSSTLIGLFSASQTVAVTVAAPPTAAFTRMLLSVPSTGIITAACSLLISHTIFASSGKLLVCAVSVACCGYLVPRFSSAYSVTSVCFREISGVLLTSLFCTSLSTGTPSLSAHSAHSALSPRFLFSPLTASTAFVYS